MMKEINITTRDGDPIVSSREIAINFKKEHRGVLRDLDNLKEGVAQNWADLFHETVYTHKQNKQEYREVLMNRDGFTLLAMGFTGKKALTWKLKYIDAFNEMEKALVEPQDSYMIQDPIERAKAWIEEEGKRKALEEQNELNKPKVLFAEAVENSEDVILVKEMALILTQNGFDIGQNQFYEYLRENGFLCKKAGDMYHLPTRKYEHFFKVTKRNVQTSKGIMVKNTPKVTGKGQLYFMEKFQEYKENGVSTRDLLTKEAM